MTEQPDVPDVQHHVMDHINLGVVSERGHTDPGDTDYTIQEEHPGITYRVQEPDVQFVPHPDEGTVTISGGNYTDMIKRTEDGPDPLVPEPGPGRRQ